MRTSPVVVSSMPPSTSAGGPSTCSAASRSAPSAIVTCGPAAASAATCAATPSGLSPCAPRTSTPRRTSAAATSSWVDSGLAAHSATLAPPSASAATKFAVSAVTCRQAATRTPASGCSTAKRPRIERRTGICPSAHTTRASPSPARERSATSCGGSSVAVMIRLVGPVDLHPEVGGLLGRELGEPSAERVEVQAGAPLVGVLGQGGDALLGPVGVGEQLHLGGRLSHDR